MHAAVAAGREWGRCDLGRGQALQVEFVSANPTGPLGLMHGRGAALGDALANLFAACGYRVEREFLVNDADGQAARLGRSVEAACLRLLGEPAPAPEDGYEGDTIRDLAQSILDHEGGALRLPGPERLQAVTRLSVAAILAEQRETLADFGVRFDRWYSEQELHASGQVQETVEQLRRAGHVYESEGALWLGSRDLGDDKDHPLVRSNGLPTYIAADVAYHADKFRRGFDRVVDVWGPEHAQYVSRTRAGVRALGIAPDRLEVIIFGPVTLRVDGIPVEAPNWQSGGVWLRDLVQEVGADVARLFYLSRPAGEALEFDLDLAKQPGPENPARRILAACREAEAEAARARGEPPSGDPDLAPLAGEAEQALIEAVAAFPEQVRRAVEAREPKQITDILVAAAGRFEAFQQARPPSGGTPEIQAARARLAEATGIVMRNALEMIGVSAVERTDVV